MTKLAYHPKECKSPQLEMSHYQISSERTHQLQGHGHLHMRRLPKSHSCCRQEPYQKKCLRKKMVWDKLHQWPKRGAPAAAPEGWIKLSKEKVNWDILASPVEWTVPYRNMLYPIQKVTLQKDSKYACRYIKLTKHPVLALRRFLLQH